MRRVDYAEIEQSEDRAREWAIDQGLIKRPPECLRCGASSKWSEKRQIWYYSNYHCNHKL